MAHRARGGVKVSEAPPTRSDGDITIVIERGDRWDIADLLLDEAIKLEADARGRRRNSPARASLLDKAGRPHALSVRIRP